MTLKNKLLIFTFLLLIAFYNPLKAQNDEKMNFNGWEFLTWNTNIAQVENSLSKIKKLNINYYKDNGYSTFFKYNEMFTYLFYDSLKNLMKVAQHADFSVSAIKKADAFFLKTKKNLIKNYGLPSERNDDKENEIISINWNLKYTTIQLTYNYKYRIIDEMGCCSYSINIVFIPTISIYEMK